jgi:hypothetical protein
MAASRRKSNKAAQDRLTDDHREGAGVINHPCSRDGCGAWGCIGVTPRDEPKGKTVWFCVDHTFAAAMEQEKVNGRRR